MFSTYRPDDVTVLLKNVTGLVKPLGAQERERLIQGGAHYSEMLPIEYEPSPAYLRTYYDALERFGQITADTVGLAAEQIWAEKGPEGALVSLARAGTPVGILLRRYLRWRYHADLPHYTISIIRGRGIDRNAMDYILARHRPGDIQFVDGWTGKGAIQRQLDDAMKDYPDVDPSLAVLSDPACVAGKFGTRDDFLIASSCLNSTISGLLSRTFLRGDIIGEQDFHGAVFYENLKEQDLTYQYIGEIESRFRVQEAAPAGEPEPWGDGLEEVRKISREFHIDDINLIKPSIGEATRVLLRRVPWKILVSDLHDRERLGHLFQLAREKQVEVAEYPLRHYRACGLIRKMGGT